MPAILTKETLLEGKSSLKVCCPLCEARDAHILFVRNEERFTECRACGLIFRDPQPTQEENQKYFQTEYYDSLGELNPHIQKARRNSLFLKVLEECRDYRKSGRLLDVGSGYGDFLKMAQAAGWEAWGIEPSRAMTAKSQKEASPKILNTTVEEADFPPDYFDVITLWNVVDYLSDPVRTLRKVSRWLSPQGILILRVPNAGFHAKAYGFYSRLSPFLKKIGWRKDPSVFHSVNFNSKTLETLLRKAGFCDAEITNAEPTQGDPYQVSSHSMLTQAAKSFLYAAARAISFLSRNRIFAGPSLVAHVYKTNLKSRSAMINKMQARIVLKHVVLCALASLGYLLGFPLWFKLLGKDRELKILLYHSVDEFKKGDMNVRASEFDKQLDFLKKHFAVTPLAKALECLDQGERPGRPAVAITFDDGYENNYHVVYPLLRKKALPATIFLLTSGKENRKTGHLGDDLANDSKLLEWEQIREMAHSDLITFGSHGQTHQRLKPLPGEKLSEEIHYSKSKIESEIGKPVHFFAYPYGTYEDFDDRIEALVREAGYQAAFSAMIGVNGLRTNRFAFKRIGIEASDSLFTFRAKLNGALSLLDVLSWPGLRQLIRGLDSLLFKMERPKAQEPPLLLVSADFPPHTNGVSTISGELSRRIALRGQKVIALGPGDKGDREFDTAQPYQVFRFPGYDWGYLRFLPIFLQTVFIIFRYDIRKIFAMNIAYAGIIGWGISFVRSLKYVVFAYGYEFEKVKNNPLLKRWYQSIYRRSEGVIGCSELVRQRLIGFGVAPEKIKVLYPGVDLNLYRPCQVSERYLEEKGFKDRRVLLTVGRLVERKGHDKVLEALQEVVRHIPETLYCIVGSGVEEMALRQKVRELHLEKVVRFMGWVPHEEIVSLYNACELFIMPSREIAGKGHVEGFGIVYLEANACGKPVIGGRSGGVLEAIRDGETGFLVDPYNSDEIARKIIFFLSHPERAKEMGLKGLERVRESFSWERYAEQACRYLNP